MGGHSGKGNYHIFEKSIGASIDFFVKNILRKESLFFVVKHSLLRYNKINK